MQRRKFIAGVGSLAAGAAAVTGTGAFTSVSANRAAQVNIAGDSSALLALDDSNSTNANYVEYTSNDEAYLNLESDNGQLSQDPSGINTDADTGIKDLFRVRNQGTQPVFVYVDPYSVTPQTVRYRTGDGDWDGDGNVEGGESDTMYFDAIMSGAPNGRRDGGSLTAIYDLPGRSGNPSFPDQAGLSRIIGAGSPGYNGNEWILDSGEELEFGVVLNVPQGDTSSYDISMDLVADAEAVPSWYSG